MTSTIREAVENVVYNGLPPSARTQYGDLVRQVTDSLIETLERREREVYGDTSELVRRDGGPEPVQPAKGGKRKQLAQVTIELRGLQGEVAALKAFASEHGFTG